MPTTAPTASETALPDVEASAGVHSLLRLRPYLYRYRWSLATMAFAAVADVIVTVSIPLVTEHMIDGPIKHHELGPVVPLGVLALALGICDASFIWLRRWVQSNAVLGLETTMRNDLYRKLQSLPMSFHARWSSGQLLSRAIQDLSQIRRFSGYGVIFLAINTLQLLLTTGILLKMYWPLGIVVAAAAVPIVLASMRFEKRYTKVSRRVQDQQGDLSTLSEEGAVGIRVIKSFGRAEHVARQYEAQARKLNESSIVKVRMASGYWTFLGLTPNVVVAIVLAFGAVGVSRGWITAGELVAFITLMLGLVWPLAALGEILAMAQEAMTASARIFEILDTEPAIGSGSRVIEQPQGHVRLEGVRFAFPDAGPGEEVLRGLDLEIRPGETVALVGATGSGKTLLTSLLPRLYDVTGGRVTIDGVDVRELRLEHLRALVATAFEEPTLFSMSARENLALGRADATEAEVAQALEVAQAGFVHELPWGLDTRIGEQGMALSGGQRQRLALARAVLARPKVLVLDDTLSALDVHTEKLVEEALRRVLVGTTGLIVAHRASTVLLADRVALLQDGVITHTGPHRELLATVPAYRELLAAYERRDADDLDDLEGATR